MKFSNYFYYIIAFGISLSSVSFKIPISIAISDLTVLLLLFLSIFSYKKITFSSIANWTLLLALYLLLANLINFFLIREFSMPSFLTNYLRVIAILGIIFLLPGFMSSLNLKLLARALMIAVNFHCLLVFFDLFISYPWNFNEDGFVLGAGSENSALEGRGRGLFDEPSFFAAYVGLISSLILQYQSYSKIVIFKPINYLILVIGLIASASLTGAAVLLLLLVQLLLIERKKILSFTSITSLIAVLLVTIPLSIFLLAQSFSYISSRTTDLEDGSTLGRLVGSAFYTLDIIEERPLVGVGMGSENQLNFSKTRDQSILFDLIENEDGDSINLHQSVVTYWASLVAAGGIPALIIFYVFVIGALLVRKETFLIGIMILALGMAKGGVFEVTLWWCIAVGIAYISNHSKISQEKEQ